MIATKHHAISVGADSTSFHCLVLHLMLSVLRDVLRDVLREGGREYRKDALAGDLRAGQHSEGRTSLRVACLRPATPFTQWPEFVPGTTIEICLSLKHVQLALVVG